jgi:hypothetical protein
MTIGHLAAILLYWPDLKGKDRPHQWVSFARDYVEFLACHVPSHRLWGVFERVWVRRNCSYEESEPEQVIDHESYLVRSPLEAGTNPLPAGFFRVFRKGF